MKLKSHLILEETDLAPMVEWEPPSGCWVFFRADQGYGYWLGHGETLEVGPGCVLVLPPARVGVLRISQLSSFHCQWFRFCPDMMGGILTVSELHLFKKQKPNVRLFPVNHPVAQAFHALVLAGAGQNGFLIRGRMLELIGLVFSCDLAANTIVEGAVLSVSKRIKLLMNHLTEEEFIRASSEELSAWCGSSVRHFNRLFRDEFGVSLRVRQTELRLLKACRLLVETDSRVMKVATDCGYRHLGVFNGQFKERFGMTPTEWRKRGTHLDGEPERTNGAASEPERPSDFQQTG